MFSFGIRGITLVAVLAVVLGGIGSVKAEVVYIGDIDGDVGVWDTVTSTGAALGNLGALPHGQNIGLAYDASTNTVLILDRSMGQVFTMDAQLGNAALLFTTGGMVFEGGAVKGSLLYGIDESAQRLAAFSLPAGVNQGLAGPVFSSHAHALGIDPATGQLYTLMAGQIRRVNDDGTDGGLVVNTPIGGYVNDLDFFAGDFLATQSSSIVLFDGATGAQSLFLDATTLASMGLSSVTGIAVVGLPPCDLRVDPWQRFDSSGYERGPFGPSSKIYALTNSGPNSLIWDVNTTCSWLDLYPSGGNLPPGANTTVTVSVNALANNLEVGIYSGEIIFRDLTSDCNVVRNATLEVLIEPILELAIPDTARVVDSDGGIYVVGTDGGDLYVLNETGEYTVTALGAGYIHDVRIEHPFIAVAAGWTVIELSLDELTPVELWRNNPGYYMRSVDLSEDGGYVAYLSYRQLGVIQNGSVVASYYLQGYSGATNWLDATADMQYIAITDEPCPPGPGGTQTGVELYEFDGSSLALQWGVVLMTNYETVEVRVSDAKDYVAAATSSGTFMEVLDMNDGSLVCEYETPGQEQFACDGDDNLNYVIGATQAWSPPYSWFILTTEDCCEVVAGGDMSGPINDLDSTPDASHFAFGSDTGEFILLSRSDDAVDIDFEGNVDMSIDAIEIGDISLLVGGDGFINLYPIEKEAVDIDIKPGSCPNPLNVESKGVLPVAVLGSAEFDVNTIDIASVRLERVAPIRSSLEDVGAPVIDANDCNCTEDGPDGYTDLTLKFKTQEIAEVLGDVNDGDVLSLGLTGALSDETPIEGADCIVVIGKVPRWMKAKKSDANEDGIIDFRDFCLMAEYWLEASAE
jgi:hypothetical protein